MAKKTVLNPAGLDPHERPAYRRLMRGLGEALRPEPRPLRHYSTGEIVARDEVRPDVLERCHGVTESGRRCRNGGQYDGFCGIHRRVRKTAESR